MFSPRAYEKRRAISRYIVLDLCSNHGHKNLWRAASISIQQYPDLSNRDPPDSETLAYKRNTSVQKFQTTS
jgi:hypothetical protein